MAAIVASAAYSLFAVCIACLAGGETLKFLQSRHASYPDANFLVELEAPTTLYELGNNAQPERQTPAAPRYNLCARTVRRYAGMVATRRRTHKQRKTATIGVESVNSVKRSTPGCFLNKNSMQNMSTRRWQRLLKSGRLESFKIVSGSGASRNGKRSREWCRLAENGRLKSCEV